MEDQTLITLGSALLATGVAYGVLNTRLKSVEQKQAKHDDHAERLIRLETKLDIIIETVSNKK